MYPSADIQSRPLRSTPASPKSMSSIPVLFPPTNGAIIAAGIRID
jgi:hypothetical protein